MPSSEDKQGAQGANGPTIERFEKIFIELLQSHARYQKKTLQLEQENRDLKELLRISKTHLNVSTQVDKNLKKPFKSDKNDELVRQINTYIKEIDICLAYFEQA
ncbi:hypothetical protein [Candidatus Cardinium hertigii]|jgi:hypothetical protein|uniref:Uncharacterized protein n=1 Tax=Candidatus Cardinium hertigii TaxID=247481 RepID=A0A3N2QB98_9BACT|nr:hypothetical protein [Candidatus Cardinium hertigii]ROT47093.1 hypothetical protein EDM02_04355 [Candidatus Cardinium hertigii]